MLQVLLEGVLLPCNYDIHTKSNALKKMLQWPLRYVYNFIFDSQVHKNFTRMILLIWLLSLKNVWAM